MAERLFTPNATLSYPYLFERQKAMEEGGKEKYSCVLVFTPENQADSRFKAMKKAAVDAAIEKWGDKAAGMIRSGKLRMPFRDDWEEKGYPEGSVFITVKSDKQPGIVSIFPDPNNNNKPKEITDREEVYAGCIVAATVRPYGYDQKGNKGVSFALVNIQKKADGERLDGRSKAADEFEADMDAVASLADMGTDEDTEAGGDDEDDLPEPPKASKPTHAASKPATVVKPGERWVPPTAPQAAEEPPKKRTRGPNKPKAAEPVTVPAENDDLSDLYE